MPDARGWLRFKDGPREVCIALDSIRGWSNDRGWVKVYDESWQHWELTKEGSENFLRAWAKVTGENHA